MFQNTRDWDLSVGLKLTDMEKNDMDAETSSVGLCSCLYILSSSSILN